MNHEPFFTVTGLTAGYGGPDILRGVEFSTAPGLVTGILGANGSGKTTLLKAVCGLLPHGGQSLLAGCALGSLPPRQLAGGAPISPSAATSASTSRCWMWSSWGITPIWACWNAPPPR